METTERGSNVLEAMRLAADIEPYYAHRVSRRDWSAADLVCRLAEHAHVFGIEAAAEVIIQATDRIVREAQERKREAWIDDRAEYAMEAAVERDPSLHEVYRERGA